jgi:hypothetical protein
VEAVEVEGVLTELLGVRGEKIELDPLEWWEDGVCGENIELFPGVLENIPVEPLLGDFVGDLSNDEEGVVGNGMANGLIGGSGFVGDFLGDPRDSLNDGDGGMDRILAEAADLGEEEANILVNEDAVLG